MTQPGPSTAVLERLATQIAAAGACLWAEFEMAGLGRADLWALVPEAWRRGWLVEVRGRPGPGGRGLRARCVRFRGERPGEDKETQDRSG